MDWIGTGIVHEFACVLSDISDTFALMWLIVHIKVFTHYTGTCNRTGTCKRYLPTTKDDRQSMAKIAILYLRSVQLRQYVTEYIIVQERSYASV